MKNKQAKRDSPPAFYLPSNHVRIDLLIRADGRSHCEWKGGMLATSTYIAAWSYEQPFDTFTQIAGYRRDEMRAKNEAGENVTAP